MLAIKRLLQKEILQQTWNNGNTEVKTAYIYDSVLV